ncbi:MAG: DUF2851 family protein [Rikenellaceae bacterium]
MGDHRLEQSSEVELLKSLVIDPKRSCCGQYIERLDSINLHSIYQELSVERLGQKSLKVLDCHLSSKMDWNQVFLLCFLDALSDMNNRHNYEEVGQRVLFGIIQRERRSLRSIEAMLIGAAGLLDCLPNDSFSTEFKTEAKYMLYKYGIRPLPPNSWNLRNLTPVKHPIVRLSQVARLFYDSEHPFNRLVSCKSRNDVIDLFNVNASEELCKRVNLKSTTSSHIGVMKCDLLAINFVVPMLYSYGIYTESDDLVIAASDLNERLPAESNFYITAWRRLGVVPMSAYDTQALIQLSKIYCINRLCHKCPLYLHMISPNSALNKRGLR